VPDGPRPQSDLQVPRVDGDAGVPPTGRIAPLEEEPPLLEARPFPAREPGRPPRRSSVRLAWVVALATDAIQWVLWPIFAPGAASPFNDVLDVIAAVVLVRLVGWHWAFLPAFLVEIVPGVDLVPTWTAAVFLATRGARRRGRAG
jgi:hypothetical protein